MPPPQRDMQHEFNLLLATSLSAETPRYRLCQWKLTHP